jgi:hypothetical protein
MSESFLSSRGAIYEVQLGTAKKYNLKPKGLFSKDAPNSVALFTGYTLNEQEIVAKNSCLNDQRVMYTFGKGFGDIVINGEILMGAPISNSKAEADLLKFYEDNRVSKKKKDHLTLSVASESKVIPFYLVGVSIVGYNVELEILNFRIIGVLAE